MNTYIVRRQTAEIVGRDCEGDLYGIEYVELAEDDPWIEAQKVPFYEWRLKYFSEGTFEQYLEAMGMAVKEHEQHLVVHIPPPEPAVKPERTTFIKALEDAFWLSGGPKLLTELARDNPLEFIKICSKLIPVDVTNKSPQGGFAISFNISAPPDNDKTIEHEEAPDD